MKRMIVGVATALLSLSVFAYNSGIAFQTEKNSGMQVIVNGKLCNATAKTFVRVTGKPGLYHVEIKVLNPLDKVWYVVRKDVIVNKGYEFYYKVNFIKNKRPTLELMKRYPSFNKDYSTPITLQEPLLA